MALKSKKKKKSEAEMSFLEHLEELRWHIIRSILAIVVFMVLAFVFKNIIFDHVILAPKDPDFFTNRILCQLGHLVGTDKLCINTTPFEIINIKMSGQLTTHITVAMVSGLILAFPFIIREFWLFFKPALHTNEAQYARGAVLASSLLFFAGVLFGYYMLAPLSIHFLTSYEVSMDVTNQINIRSFIGTLSSICLATGVIFELPIIAFFLTKIGVITPEFMKKYRKHSIVVIVILSAIITPPDVFSQLLVCIPLMFLYEVSIHISKRVVQKKERDYQEFMNDNDPGETIETTS
ncbi:MAG TPA: twin-arginine translocase subunit TatC [Bacteroidales bacterium]|nr:twin-arginine translocase subunit TatC [Bacteroidales bacterium]HPI67795.1 twin-arginine translocase subunit TatC [Bacteroidales bacterium]HPR72336.1 twin-arginine translocase subunit TatC [Bacteroidales bacterium]